MDPQRLNKKFNEALEKYREETNFLVDSFNESEPLRKNDMEQMSALVFYTLSQFKEIIVEHAKDKDR